MTERREAYIDVLRGFTIILVVLYHLDNIVFDRAFQFIYDVIETFMLPTFFFISGFLSYKDSPPTRIFIKSQIIKRLVTQIIPTIIICVLFFILLGGMSGKGSLLSVPMNPYKGGYWYTIVAYELYLIYIYIRFYVKHFKIKKYETSIYALVILIGVCYAPIMAGDLISDYVMRLFCIQLMMLYLPSFMAGILVRKFISYCKPSFIYVVFVGASYLSLLLLPCTLLKGVTLILGCLFLFLIFQNLDGLFRKTPRLVSFMSWIGRNTLQIYLLHYWIIAMLRYTSIEEYKGFYQMHPFLTFTLGIIFAVVISILCLFATLSMKKIRIYNYIFPNVNRI